MLRTATTALAFAASASAVPTPDAGVMRVPVTVQPAKFSTKAPGTVRVMLLRMEAQHAGDARGGAGAQGKIVISNCGEC